MLFCVLCKVRFLFINVRPSWIYAKIKCSQKNREKKRNYCTKTRILFCVSVWYKYELNTEHKENSVTVNGTYMHNIHHTEIQSYGKNILFFSSIRNLIVFRCFGLLFVGSDSLSVFLIKIASGVWCGTKFIITFVRTIRRYMVLECVHSFLFL